jgi:hypothetical protein
MSGRRIEDLRRELNHLMQEQVETLQKETFGGLGKEELRQEEERLKKIREVSADFLEALKRNLERPPSG